MGITNWGGGDLLSELRPITEIVRILKEEMDEMHNA
jgi:hypothetical protein